MKQKVRTIWIRLRHWEYWPIWLVYFPVSFYYFYLSLKARSFFFFSAANPSIETGGMFFESKWDIFQLIPSMYYPKTILVNDAGDRSDMIEKLKKTGLDFPLIAKPNRGERGWCVEILHNEDELGNYLQHYPQDFLLQEYISYPVELSVFYFRHPHEEKGRVTSLTKKIYLAVEGNGVSSILGLVSKQERALLQLEKLKHNKNIDLERIPGAGEKVILVPFGNHIRGAMFLDCCNEIDEQLNQVFDGISKQINGFYFGRFDIKCESLESLKSGRNFSILELNGSGAEPAHIYQPGFSFFKAQKVLAAHYRMMYMAASANHSDAVRYMSFRTFRETRAAEKKYKLSVPSF